MVPAGGRRVTSFRSAPGALLLLLFALAPVASALTPDVVRPVVAEVTYVETYESAGVQYDADVNLTWKLSANDPDQTTGSFGYRVVIGQGAEPTLWITPASIAAVPNRAGWVYYVQQLAVGAGTATNFNFTIVANDTASSGFSCIVSLTVTTLTNQSQCDSEFAEPEGVSLLTTTRASTDYGANATLRWRVSANDTDQTNGTGLEYWTWIGPAPESMFNYTGNAQSVDSTGVLSKVVEQFTVPDGVVPLYAKVRARDSWTHERSEFSCVVFVENGEPHQGAQCGTLPMPDGAFGELGNVTFPMADLDVLADMMQTEPWVVGAFLGTVTVFGLALAGLMWAGPVGAAVGGTLGLAFTAALAVLPAWFLVIIVFVSALIIAAGFSRGGGS